MRSLLSDEELQALASGDEAKVLELCQLENSRSLADHADFEDRMNNVDPLVCRRLELVDLMRNAPNPEQRQYLLAIYQFRQSINLIAGRSFS